MKESSETIPEGSTSVEQMEKVALFYFYVLIDPRDNLPKYIGRTVFPQNRLRNHIWSSLKFNRNKKERWIVALLRANKKPIMSILVSGKMSLQEAVELEKRLTLLFDKSYNLKNGTDNAVGAILTGTPVFQYTMEGVFIKEYPNANQAEIETGVRDCNIGRACKNSSGRHAGRYRWSYTKYENLPNNYYRSFYTKEILQLKDDVVIKQWSSAREASKVLGIPWKHISAVCNGRQKTTGKFSWKFVE